jgi:hypothetical protein
MNNLSHVVPKDGSKTSWSRISPGGPIEVELEKIKRGWGPIRGTVDLPIFGLALWLHMHLQVPSFQNDLFLGLTLRVFMEPGLAVNGFTDESFNPFLSSGRGGLFGVEYSLISFFPD